MARHFLLRALYTIPTIVAALFLTFSLAKLTPGDPITQLLSTVAASGGLVSDAEREAMAEVYGLNRPFMAQFVDYLWNILSLDFGYSIKTNRPISVMLARSLPISLQLGGASMLILIVVGIPLGTLAGIRNGTWIDNLIVGLSVTFRAIPVFVLAPILLVVLVLELRIMDVPIGWSGLFHPSMILPVVLLAAAPLPSVIQQTRIGVLNVLSDDYIRTARAKGLPPFTILVRHTLRNALIPVVTVLSLVLSHIIVSTLFIDTIFSFPGFGSIYYNAISALDYPVLLSTTALVTVSVSLANFLVDVLYAVLDPRVRFQGGGRS